MYRGRAAEVSSGFRIRFDRCLRRLYGCRAADSGGGSPAYRLPPGDPLETQFGVHHARLFLSNSPNSLKSWAILQASEPQDPGSSQDTAALNKDSCIRTLCFDSRFARSSCSPIFSTAWKRTGTFSFGWIYRAR